MQGRIESELKKQKTIDRLLSGLPKYVTEWYFNLKASQVTPSSCSDYISKISKFLTYINPNPLLVSPDDITINVIEQYFISMQTRTLKNGNITYTSDSYKQGIWCALNNFLSFMNNRGYINKNYMTEINKPKNKDLERINDNRILLTKKDFNKILYAAQHGAGSYRARLIQRRHFRNRDTLIILLFMTTGMRKTAMSEINIDDIDAVSKTLTVIDKGNKRHNYVLNDNVLEYLNLWMTDRENILKTSGSKSDALLLNTRGERLTGYGISQLVEKYCEDALGKKISPHKLRSGFCSILYSKTHDAEFVRRAVGHSNISTTQRYIRTNNKEKEIASNIMNDLLNI